MAEASVFGLVVINMKVNGAMIKWMVKVFLNLQVVENILVVLLTVCLKVMARQRMGQMVGNHIFAQWDFCIKIEEEMEHCVVNTSVIFMKAVDMAKGCWNVLMGLMLECSNGIDIGTCRWD